MTALRDTDVPVPDDLRAVRGRGRARRAVLRDGAGGRARRTAAPPQLEPLGAERTARDLDPDGRHARDPARGRPGGGRARPTSAGPRASWPGRCGAGRSSSTPRAAATCRRPTSCTRALEATCPTQSAPGIVHGDYRLDNMLVDDDDRVAAVHRLGDGHPRRPAHRRRRCCWSTSGWPASTDGCAVADASPRRPASSHDDEMHRAVRRAQRPRPVRDRLLPRPGLLQARGDPRGHPLPLPARADRRRRASTRRRRSSSRCSPPDSPRLKEHY